MSPVQVVRFIGACCELPAGLTDALAEAAAVAAAAAAAAAGNSSSNGSMSSSGDLQQQQQQQQLPASSSSGSSVRCVPARLARGVKLAIVMELASLGSLFSMIGQVRPAYILHHFRGQLCETDYKARRRVQSASYIACDLQLCSESSAEFLPFAKCSAQQSASSARFCYIACFLC